MFPRAIKEICKCLFQFQKVFLEDLSFDCDIFGYRYIKLILRFNGRNKDFVKTFKNEKTRHQWEHTL